MTLANTPIVVATLPFWVIPVAAICIVAILVSLFVLGMQYGERRK